jgi:hypothetical protein
MFTGHGVVVVFKAANVTSPKMQNGVAATFGSLGCATANRR